MNLLILGGGPAGYTAAERAARAGLNVTLFEKHSLGGVCLGEGCIPTKTLLQSAKIYDHAREARKYAVNVSEVTYDLPRMIARKQKVVRKLALGIQAKLQAAGVTVVMGEGEVVDAQHVACGGQTYEADYLLLCTGSEAVVPPITGLDTVPYWTHREALAMKALPASLAIIGGGVIGMEFASLFTSLGTKVTVVERLPEILGGLDGEVSALLRAEYAKRGVRFLLGASVVGVKPASVSGEGIQVDYVDPAGVRSSVTAQQLLVSTGRRPVLAGLETLDLACDARGRLVVDAQMRTSLPTVFACGDLTGRSMLAHTAVREAEVAVNTILGQPDEMSYRAIPSVVYTNPEAASVGATEEELKRMGTSYHALRLPMTYSGRFVAENEGMNGLCKLLLADDQTLLGAHLLGNPASEIIAMAGMAIDLGLTARQWGRTVLPHPSVGEIFKEAISHL